MGASSRENLKLKGITHILNITENMPNKFPHDFVYKTVKVTDSEKTNLVGRFPDIFNFISEALRNKQNKILIHCYAGVSRSATVVIGYLMKTQQMPLDLAFKFVRT